MSEQEIRHLNITDLERVARFRRPQLRHDRCEAPAREPTSVERLPWT